MGHSQTNVLPLFIISSNSDNRKCYQRQLAKCQEDFPAVIEVESISDALKAIRQTQSSCCLIDYASINKDELALLKRLRDEYTIENLPVIVMFEEHDDDAFDLITAAGAQDCLVVGELTPAKLYRSIVNAVQTSTLQKQLNQLAHYDVLTGLLNRSLLINRIGQAIHRCKRYRQECAMLYIDIENFAGINDVYGHDVGDAILQDVADRIRENCRATDSPSRVGGDEFLVLLEQVDNEIANKIAIKILKSLQEPIFVNGKEFQISVSVGISVYPETANSGDDLLKQAAEALLQAKKNEFSKCVNFSKEFKREWTRQRVLERSLARAIENDELKLAYQPIVDVNTYELKRLEVLSRWPREDYDVPALELMDMVDRLGLTEAFHEWLFNAAFKQAYSWNEESVVADMCLNIPANYCYNKNISRCIERALSFYSIDPQRVELEITESALMLHPERSIELLESLHHRGLRVAVDDFGTGYSSMAYLTKLPLDTLKIDKQFFLENAGDVRNEKVISAVVALGHSLGLEIIAEGIETESELKLAREVDCDLLQGFYFGRPQFAGKNWDDFVKHFPGVMLPKATSVLSTASMQGVTRIH